MDFDNVYFITFLITTVFLYFISIAVFYGNRFNHYISIRSEKVLQMGNLGIFLNIITHLLKPILNHPSLEYLKMLFTFLIIISIIFRYLRIVLCTQISSPKDALLMPNEIENKSYHYEFLYMRYLLISVFSLLVILIILYFAFDNKKIDDPLINTIIWMSIHGVFLFALITLGLFISTRTLDYYIRTEYCTICLLIFLYYLIVDYFNVSNIDAIETDYEMGSYCFHIGFNMALLTLIIAFPLLERKFFNKTIVYSFPPQLTNDLYLFLCNEECFDLFYNYLSVSQLDNKGVFLLELYLKLIRLQFMFDHGDNNDYNRIKGEMDNIFIEYFSQRSLTRDYISDQDKNDIQKKYNEQNNEEITFVIFNGGLTLCFRYLIEQFKKYQQSQEYIDLVDKMKYDNHIQEQLCSSGLIFLNKEEI